MFYYLYHAFLFEEVQAVLHIMKREAKFSISHKDLKI